MKPVLLNTLLGGLLGILMAGVVSDAAAETKAKSTPLPKVAPKTAPKSSSKPAAKAAPKSAPAKSAGGPAVAQRTAVGKEWQGPEAFVVLPGRTLELQAVCREGADVEELAELAPASKKTSGGTFLLSRAADFLWKVPVGTVERLGDNRLRWEAPSKPGHYQIACEIERRGSVRVSREGAGEKSRELPVFRAATVFHLLVPCEFDPEGRGVIDNVPVGVYPNEKDPNVKAVIADHRDRYRPPRWFVAVTPEIRELFVSDHFRLREFVPEAPKETATFFPYNEDLCRVLEGVLEELRTANAAEPHVRILRGFVSPYDAERQRRAGARLLTWNRYQYGDAALIVANRDAGTRMADLDGDGKVDIRDAEALYQIVLRVQKGLGLPGWIGVYGERPDPTLPETPMVGFDLRGYWAETYGVDTSKGE